MAIKQKSHSDPEYHCTRCQSHGDRHEIVQVPAGPSKNWGGCPSYKLRCTRCGDESGPWVPASLVGDY